MSKMSFNICPEMSSFQGICQYDNIKIDLRVIRWDGMHWIDLAQNRDQRRALVNMVKNFWVPTVLGIS
jgi:hypothetical protein